jgi:hypothetical protein
VSSLVPGLESLVPGIRAHPGLRSKINSKWVHVLVVCPADLAVAVVSGGWPLGSLTSPVMSLVVALGIISISCQVIFIAEGTVWGLV